MRKLALLSGSFAAGIFLAQYLLPDGMSLSGASACLALGVLSLFLPEKLRKRCVLLFVGIAFGLGYNWLYVRQVQAPMLTLAETEADAVMTLCEYARPTDYGAKATVQIEGLSGKLVYYGGEELLMLQPGDVVSDTVSFTDASCVRDEEITTFTSRDVFLLAYGRGDAVCTETDSLALRWIPARAGEALRREIDARFSGETAGFLTAIITGDKSGLSERASIALSEAGLSHILAVSGMHCGFLLSMILLLAGNRRRLTAFLAIPLLAFYAFLTGCSPSVTRACIMLIFVVLAPLFRRGSDGPTALCAALALILLHNPFAAASISLQLSFGAVAGLFWLTPRLYALLTGEERWNRAVCVLAASFSATIGALVFTIPLSAVYFGTLTLISPLSNLLCLWAAGLIFMLGLGGVMAGMVFAPLGALTVFPLELLTGYLLKIAELLSAIPYHAVYFTNPYLKYWLCFAYLLFAAAWLLRRAKPRGYLAASALAALALVFTVHLGQARYRSALDVLVLDVGQGECVILASGGEFALVDCGSANSWYDAGNLANQYLRSMGCEKLNHLILTHWDSDHMNGTTGLLTRMDICEILAPTTDGEAAAQATVFIQAEHAGMKMETVETEQILQLGNAEIRILPPLGSDGDNEQGLTILATIGEQDLLITGDMSRATEKILLETYALPDIEVLVAGHHGSKSSTGEALLDALKPETVCISVGSNSYGHPNNETLYRLAERKCVVYRTDLHGTIELSMN